MDGVDGASETKDLSPNDDSNDVEAKSDTDVGADEEMVPAAQASVPPPPSPTQNNKESSRV